ncbi:hypothetical protein AALP_AA1G001000 [Arabis alpina]|uniref:WAT1-related protein n=1 Tax=Arabis alpina TaxID=50452 RepID=A0A087HK43_ARAAL|nr:hypothetical protein AALP_AA1G001000 [Arabis alpina]
MGYMDGKWAPVIMAIVVNIIMGIFNALLKHVLDGGVDHMVMATYRLALATVFLFPIAFFLERKTRPKMTLGILCQLFFCALLGSSLTQYFILLGLERTSASVSSAFWSILPAFTFVMSLLCRLEKINIKTKGAYGIVFGILACMGGALLLTFYKGVSLTGSGKLSNKRTNTKHDSENYMLGSLLLLIGVTFYSSWMILQAKISVKYPSQYSSTVIITFFGTIQAALLSLINSRELSDWAIENKNNVIIIVVTGVIGQGLCTVGVIWCIRKLGPAVTTIFTPIMLIAATLFDYLIFRTPIYLGSVLGSIVIVIGLYTFLWGKAKHVKECAMLQPINKSKNSEEVVLEVEAKDKDENHDDDKEHSNNI